MNADTPNNAYININSSGYVNDYDSRIVATGGSYQGNGQGYLNIQAYSLQFNNKNIATEEYVTSRGYLTSAPTNFSTLTLNAKPVATEEYVTGRGYLTAVPSSYATQSWVQDQHYLSTVNTNNFASLKINNNNVATEQYCIENFIGKRGYAEVSTLTTTNNVTTPRVY